MLWAGTLNFKFKIVFLNTFFSRFGDRKNESHFLKKSHLQQKFVFCWHSAPKVRSRQRAQAYQQAKAKDMLLFYSTKKAHKRNTKPLTVKSLVEDKTATLSGRPFLALVKAAQATAAAAAQCVLFGFCFCGMVFKVKFQMKLNGQTTQMLRGGTQFCVIFQLLIMFFSLEKLHNILKVSKSQKQFMVSSRILVILADQTGPNGRLSCLHSFKIF